MTTHAAVMKGNPYPGGERGDGAVPMGPDPDEIVGHKTPNDGTHEPLRRSEAEALLAACDADKARRAAAMPSEADAINMLWQAYQRLRELGWREAMYCPKDGREFSAIEAGSSGVHRCHYSGEWPSGRYWISDGDLWPSHPILFKSLSN